MRIILKMKEGLVYQEDPYDSYSEGKGGGVDITDFAFSPDGRLLVITSSNSHDRKESGAVHLLAVPDLGAIYHAVEPGGMMNCVAFSPNNHYCTANFSGEIFLWDVGSRIPLQKWHSGTEIIKDLVISSDGKYLACASYIGDISIWEWREEDQTYDCIQRIKPSGQSGVEHSISISSDGNSLLYGNSGLISLWNVKSGIKIKDYLHESIYGIRSLKFIQEDSLIVTCGNHGLYILSEISGEIENKLECFSGKDITVRDHVTNDFDVSKTGNILVSTSALGILKIWDLDKRVQTNEFHDSGSQCIRFSPDMIYLASQLGLGRRHFWKIDDALH